MSFPYHQIPDGSAALPHHATWSLLLAVVPILMVWDNQPHRDPWAPLTGVLVGVIGFVLVWPTHHVAGAVLALLGTLLVILAPLRPKWSGHWPHPQRALVVLLGLVAMDDVAQHAFGWPTPLDAIWKEGLRGIIHTPF